MVTGYDVTVRVGTDYTLPPIGGGSGALAADVLTNTAKWMVGAFGYDSSQPAPVAVAQGMRLSWSNDTPTSKGLQGAWLAAVGGNRYTLYATVTAPVGSPAWRLTSGWGLGTGGPSAWMVPDGTPQTVSYIWTATETRNTPIGIEVWGQTSSQYLVSALAAWSHSDGSLVWQPATLNRCLVALPVELMHGRSNINTQPDASSCTFTYIGDTQPCSIGDALQVETPGSESVSWTDGSTSWMDTETSWWGTSGQSIRFSGEVTSIQAIEQGGIIAAWEIQATGRLAPLGRTFTTYTPPVSTEPGGIITDTFWVDRLGSHAGVSILEVGRPGVGLFRREVSGDILSLIHELCARSAGLLWESRTGQIMYGTAHRHESAPVRRISCKAILDGVRWQRDAGKVVNRTFVEWGSVPDGDPDTDDPIEGTVEAYDQASIDRWGEVAVRVDGGRVRLATAQDALTLTSLILGNRSTPSWVMPGVIVKEEEASAVEWAQVAAVDVGDLVVIDVTESPSPTPGTATTWQVLGMVETWAEDGHRIQFALSQFRSYATVTWVEQSSRTWGEVATNETWLSAMTKVVVS